MFIPQSPRWAVSYPEPFYKRMVCRKPYWMFWSLN